MSRCEAQHVSDGLAQNSARTLRRGLDCWVLVSAFPQSACMTSAALTPLYLSSLVYRVREMYYLLKILLVPRFPDFMFGSLR